MKIPTHILVKLPTAMQRCKSERAAPTIWLFGDPAKGLWGGVENAILLVDEDQPNRSHPQVKPEGMLWRIVRYRRTVVSDNSAELFAAPASFAEISAVWAGVPQLGASLPSPQARGR